MSLNSPTLLNQESHRGFKKKIECLKNPESQTTSLQDNPLQNLQIASHEVLEKAQKSGRSKCPKCGSSRMFYCYSCYVPVETVPTKQIPVVKVSIFCIYLLDMQGGDKICSVLQTFFFKGTFPGFSGSTRWHVYLGLTCAFISCCSCLWRLTSLNTQMKMMAKALLYMLSSWPLKMLWFTHTLAFLNMKKKDMK